MEILIYLLLLFLSVIGLCDIIHSLRLSFLNVKHSKSKVVCCILKDDLADLQLQFVIEQYNWSGKRYADEIIAVNCLDDPQLIERCRRIAHNNKVRFVEKCEIHNLLNTEI